MRKRSADPTCIAPGIDACRPLCYNPGMTPYRAIFFDAGSTSNAENGSVGANTVLQTTIGITTYLHPFSHYGILNETRARALI